MNEAQLTQRFLKEGENTVRSQERLVSAVDKALKESSGRTLSQFDKVKLATVINNVSDLMMMNEAEGTQVTDIAKKAEFLNLVICTWAKSTLPQSTLTFAMGQETSVVYYLAYKYDSNKGGIEKGDTLNTYDRYWVEDSKVESASKYASEVIDAESIDIAATGTYQFEFTPIIPKGQAAGVDSFNANYDISGDCDGIVITSGNDTYEDDGQGNIYKTGTPGTTVATIDYTTGVLTSTTLAVTDGTVAYRYNNQIAPVKVPKLKLETTKLILNARAYTLNYEYSTFAAFNLLRSQNVDLKDLLGEGAANELVAEIDSLVYQDFIKAANTNNVALTFNMTPTGYYSERDYMQSFGLRLVQLQQLIFNKTRKIRPNVGILGTNGAYLARNLDGFTSQEEANPIGVHVIGNYKGITLIENPFQDVDLNILTYKGSEFTGSYAVGEYMPVVQTQLLQYEDFRNTSSLATMMAKKTLNTNFFAKLTITHN